MVYLKISKRLGNLLINPSKEWRVIVAEDNDENAILTDFILPLTGAIAMILFVLQITLFDIDLLNSLRISAISFGTSLLSVYLLFWTLKFLWGERYNTITRPQWMALSAYPSAVYIFIDAVISCFPSLHQLRLITLLMTITCISWPLIESNRQIKIHIAVVAMTIHLLVTFSKVILTSTFINHQ